ACAGGAPRRPGRSRASGSSAAGARAGRARSAPGRHRHPLPGLPRSGRSPSSSRHHGFAPRRPPLPLTPAEGRTGRCAPSFGGPRCLHSRRLQGARRRRMAHKEPEMILKNNVAVVYGAAGAIGAAVARAFAKGGARLFVTGRRRAPVEAGAKEIVSGGGFADAAEVDALDEKEVEAHLRSVVDKAGRVDISFNAVGGQNTMILGAPLTELGVEQFSEPITAYTRSYFLTARTAARQMIPNGSGVIMTVTALPGRIGTPLNGG